MNLTQNSGHAEVSLSELKLFYQEIKVGSMVKSD